MYKEAHGYTFGMYWMSNPTWYKVNKELDRFELTKEAPEKAKKVLNYIKKSMD